MWNQVARTIRRSLAVVAILGGTIMIHELGHGLAARLVGVPVIEVAVGFGPKVCSFQVGSTTYSLRALPLGGFTVPLQDGKTLKTWLDPSQQDLEPYKKMAEVSELWLESKSLPKQILVDLGGIIANLLTVIALARPIRRYWASGKINSQDLNRYNAPLQKRRFLGPIAIMRMAASSSDYGAGTMLVAMRDLSYGLAKANAIFFIPFLDGNNVFMKIFVSFMNLFPLWSLNFMEVAETALTVACVLWVTRLEFVVARRTIAKSNPVSNEIAQES